jgi:uncharacterized protein (TIGR02588 family)
VRRNWLEWLILAASVAAIVLLVGYLGAQAIGGDEPPDIRVEAHADQARATATGWELPVTVRNDGGLPAAAVAIEATATVDGADETSEITLELAAPGTETDLVIGFSAPPEGEVTFRLVGYEAP